MVSEPLLQNTRVIITRFGESEVLEVIQYDSLPEPRDDEVRVKVLATSAAFTDVMIRKGMYPDVKEKPPFTPGYDMVGVVNKLGLNTSQFEPGQYVADLTTIGAYSEYLCLPEDHLTPVPDGLDPVDAVGVILSFVIPYQMLHRVAKVQADQTILVRGAGGAVVSAMLQLARLSNVGAIETDVPAKHELIRRLNATPIDRSSKNLERQIKAVTGEGVDIVFDPIGGASLDHSLHALKPGGMLVAYGFMNAVTGGDGNIPLDFLIHKFRDLLPKGHATAFYSIGAMRRKHPQWFKDDLISMFNLLKEGKIKPIIGRTLPFTQARQAHDLVESGNVEGKVVLLVGDAL